MANFFHNFRQIIRGKQLIPNKDKFILLCTCTAFVHLIFVILMGVNGIVPLFYYNIASVIFYLSLAYVAYKTEQYFLIFVLTILEIEIHSTLCSILLGWDWGFMMYTVAFVPGSFYIENSLPDKYRKSKISFISSMLIAIFYFTVSVFTSLNYTPYSYLDSSYFRYFMLYMNTIIGFSLLLIFSFLFALEINYMNNILAQENSRLGKMANYDSMTRLYNRRGMSTFIEKAISTCSSSNDVFSLIIADIDFFKKINDTYGHDIGDDVLITFAKLFRNSIRGDDYVCRWGGEEFLFLINGNGHIAKEIGERIRQEASEITFTTEDGRTFSVHLTMGIAEYTKGISLRALIDVADEKLYYGKEHGRDQIVL